MSLALRAYVRRGDILHPGDGGVSIEFANPHRYGGDYDAFENYCKYIANLVNSALIVAGLYKYDSE